MPQPPWELYQQQQQRPPWELYGAPAGVLPDPAADEPHWYDQIGKTAARIGDDLATTTIGGMVADAYRAITYPGDVYQGKATVPQSANMPGGEDTSGIPRAMAAAAIMSPVNPAVQAGARAFGGAGPVMSRYSAPSEGSVSFVPTMVNGRLRLRPPGMKIHGTVRPTNVPTATALEDVGRRGYNRVDRAPVAVPAQPLADDVRRLEQFLARPRPRGAGSFMPEQNPETYAALNRLKTVGPLRSTAGDDTATASIRALHGLDKPPPPLTLGEIDAARQQLLRIQPNQNHPSDVAAAANAIRGLDTISSRVPKYKGTTGPAREAVAELRTARKNIAASKRVNTITGELDKHASGIMPKAEDSAAASHSGMNLDNRYRQLANALLKNRKALRGFNQQEVDAVRTFVHGAGKRDNLRHWGNYLGGGGGLGNVASTGAGTGFGAGIGFAVGGPTGAAIGGGVGTILGKTVGPMIKRRANTLARKEMEQLATMLALRSPLAKEQVRLDVLSPQRRAALVKALLLSQDEEGPLKITVRPSDKR